MEAYYIFMHKNKKYIKRKNIIVSKLFILLFFGSAIFSIVTMSCGKSKAKNKGILPDSSIYSSQNFSPNRLDSTTLASFYLEHKIEDSLKSQITEFYIRRNYQYAWFDQNGITEASHVFYNQLQNYVTDFGDLSVNSHIVDSLINFAGKEDKKKILTKIEMQNVELLLTSNYFKYAEKSFGGISKSSFDLEWYIPRKKKNFQTLLDSIVANKKNISLQEPVNQYYKNLVVELRKYKNLSKTGGFPSINPAKSNLKLGEKDSAIHVLKRYLTSLDDLKLDDSTAIFDQNLELALKNFQKRHGLKETGILDKTTLSTINTKPEERIKQLMVNLERLRWLPQELESNCLVVNIPEFKLHIFENSKPISQTNVVVGKTANKTTIFRGDLSTIVLNPYWGVPSSIAINEILPKLKNGTSYLTRNNMEVFSKNQLINPNTVNWSEYNTNLPYTFRQKPGTSNSLGKIKFLFPNNYSIYLHDTPSKGLFGETSRAFSHGCIRVQNPKNLAVYLLRNDQKWTIQQIETVLKTDTETKITIKPTVPVYILYLTAWVDQSGKLNFRKDIYGLDKKLEKEIFASEK